MTVSRSSLPSIAMVSVRAVLERVDNHLLVIEHDQCYTSFDVSVIVHKPGGRGGGAHSRGGTNFNFWPIGEALI